MIVVALFMVALVASMAYVMMSRLDRDTRRTMLLVRDTQAEFYAQGSIAWAIDLLRNNWEQKKPNQPVDRLPVTSPVNEINGYKVSSTIYDMQARFNINSVTTTEAQTQFKRLIQLIDPTMTDEQTIIVVMMVYDWISAGGSEQANQYYMELPQPYRAGHRPMQSVSELRLVRGMTPKLFNALLPYIAALPDPSTKINAQSAPPVVLAALSQGLTVDVAKGIEQLRAKTPFKSEEDFYNLDLVKNHGVPQGKITLTSAYFLVETKVSIENQNIVLYTLLERTQKDSKAAVTILWQSKGIW